MEVKARAIATETSRERERVGMVHKLFQFVGDNGVFMGGKM